MTTRKILYSLGLLLLVGLAACNKFDEMNHDPSKSGTTQPEYLFTYGEKSAMDLIYAGTQNGSIGNLYAQYWTGDQSNGSRYALDEGSNNALWSGLNITLNNLQESIRLNRLRLADVPAAKNQIACAWVVKAWIYQILLDTYGNIPFSETNDLSKTITPKYDDAATVYTQLIDTLQAQVAQMDETLPGFETGDGIFNGDMTKWKKLGNSVLLRFAIREVDAKQDEAKQVIEAAAPNAMASNADNAEFKYLGVDPNAFPYNNSQREIISYYVSSSLTDYLRDTHDPRLPVFARPATIPDTINGMRYGYSEQDTHRKAAGYYSYPGSRIYSASMPGILMQYAEVEFILAEAAARGFNTGDAETHYNNGVKASVAYWADTAAASSFLANVPYNAAKWKDVIGSQKWVALYPQGLQGWFERNRLDPKKPNGDSLLLAPFSGSVDNTVKYVPYRLSYPKSEQTLNAENYQSAVQAMGGTDTQGSKKLWWDKF